MLCSDAMASNPLSALHGAVDRDRRSEPRLSAEILGLEGDASLSQGIYVRVLNVSSGGALVELNEWIRPGTRSVLRLSRTPDGTASPERLLARGQIARCWVDRLAPLRYRAAMVFAQGATQPPPEAEVAILLERPA